MKLSRRAIAALAIVLLLLTAFSLYLQYTSSQSTGPWTQTTPYPLQAGGVAGVFGQSCVTSGSEVYCVGGQETGGSPTSAVYAAPLTPSGVGNWTSATPYPQPAMFESCVATSGYIYCTSGTKDAAGDDLASSYYAPVVQGGLGNWTSTTPYPVDADSLTCVTSSGYMYCAGGENETSGTNATATTSNSVWYARLNSSGIGAWAKGPSYPSNAYFPECVTLGGYMYCVGGEDGSGNAVSSAYYSYLTSQGMGPWTETTSYPIQADALSCTTSSTLLYCIGGLPSGGGGTQAVYYAGLTPSGIGGWQAAASFPEPLATSCVSSSGYTYCIAGYDSGTGSPTNDVYYAPLTLNSTSSSSTLG